LSSSYTPLSGAHATLRSRFVPVEGSRETGAAHSLCAPGRDHLPASGRCILLRYSRFEGIPLLEVNAWYVAPRMSRTLVIGGDVEEGAQGVVDNLVFLAARRDDVV
jgi:hypothetical protein